MQSPFSMQRFSQGAGGPATVAQYYEIGSI